MKKTFITQVPDKSGAFLKASRIIAEAGGNITHVSYNKAIDLHMLFIEVSATEEQLHQISEALRAIGYISDNTAPGQTILIEFKLPNVPSAVLPVLELIDSYHFNIPYINGQSSDDEDQTFKIGIHFKDPDKIKRFLDEAARLCSLRVLNYDKTQKMLDNTVFYISFANQLTALLNLDKSAQNALIADSNLIMQLLDDRDKAPYRTFSYISRFAEMLKQFKGGKFLRENPPPHAAGRLDAAHDRAAVRQQHLHSGKGQCAALHRLRLRLLRAGDAQDPARPVPGL